MIKYKGWELKAYAHIPYPKYKGWNCSCYRQISKNKVYMFNCEGSSEKQAIAIAKDMIDERKTP